MNVTSTALLAPFLALASVPSAPKPKKDRLHTRITDEKLEELKAALAEVQSGRGQNDISVAWLVCLAEKAEKAMALTGLSKLARRGATFAYAEAGASATSYRYRISTTKVVLRRDARGWVLADAYRITQYPKAPMHHDLTRSEAQASMLPGKLKGACNLRVRNGKLFQMR